MRVILAEDVANDEDVPASTDSASSPRPYRAARTHLVIHVQDNRPEAQFCAWEDKGPRILPAETMLKAT